MKYLAAALLLAGCASAGALHAELARLPLIEVSASVSEKDVVVRATLERALDKDLASYVSRERPAAVLVAGEGFDTRLIPAAYAGKLVLATFPQLKQLAARFGTPVPYIQVRVIEEERSLLVQVSTLQAVPPNTISLCCESRDYLYERKGDGWSLLGVDSGEY